MKTAHAKLGDDARRRAVASVRCAAPDDLPGLAIAILVLGFNFPGDGLRDSVDPKMVK